MSEAVAEQEVAFDASVFDLPIPKDSRGRKADKLALSYGGTLELDRTSEEDLDLINRLRSGALREVTIQARVAGETWTLTEDAEGNEQVRCQVRLKVVGLETV